MCLWGQRPSGRRLESWMRSVIVVMLNSSGGKLVLLSIVSLLSCVEIELHDQRRQALTILDDSDDECSVLPNLRSPSSVILRLLPPLARKLVTIRHDVDVLDLHSAIVETNVAGTPLDSFKPISAWLDKVSPETTFSRNHVNSIPFPLAFSSNVLGHPKSIKWPFQCLHWSFPD